MTVNHKVVGSNPTRGAKMPVQTNWRFFCLYEWDLLMSGFPQNVKEILWEKKKVGLNAMFLVIFTKTCKVSSFGAIGEPQNASSNELAFWLLVGFKVKTRLCGFKKVCYIC